MDMEATVMELIINAGESRSLAMQALQAARKGVWQDVDRLMQDAADAAKRAHDVQTMLIGMDEGCGKVPVNLILVHAQDHIMTSMLARELIAELIEVQRQLPTSQLIKYVAAGTLGGDRHQIFSRRMPRVLRAEDPPPTASPSAY